MTSRAPGLGDRFDYTPVLDGLRALAIGGVIVSHVGIRGVYGFHGVTVFFVISGYLITSLLVVEHRRTGGIAFRAFYRRRLARLAPALVLIVAVTCAWLLLVREPVASWWLGPPAALTYTMDLVQMTVGNGAVGHYFQWSWSLSIEEQYYLVWPVILLAILRRGTLRSVFIVSVLVVAATWVVRSLQSAADVGRDAVDYGLFGHVDALVLGSVLALALASGPRPWLMKLLRIAGPVGLLGLAVLLLHDAGLPFLSAVDPSGFGQTAVCSVALVGWCVTAPTDLVPRALTMRPLVFIGKLSYGLYLWNLLTIYVFMALVGTRPALTPWGLVWVVALVLICFLSYRFVETPLRRRLARPRGGAAVGSR